MVLNEPQSGFLICSCIPFSPFLRLDRFSREFRAMRQSCHFQCLGQGCRRPSQIYVWCFCPEHRAQSEWRNEKRWEVGDAVYINTAAHMSHITDVVSQNVECDVFHMRVLRCLTFCLTSCLQASVAYLLVRDTRYSSYRHSSLIQYPIYYYKYLPTVSKTKTKRYVAPCH
jgi:hypothetical protein